MGTVAILAQGVRVPTLFGPIPSHAARSAVIPRAMVKESKKARTLEPCTRDYTIHVHKMVQGIQFKKRAPTVVHRIKNFAEKAMKTNDVRIDTKLNKHIWSNGVRNVAKRVRVRLSRMRNEDEDAKENMYTLVQHVPVESFKGLQTEKVEED